MKTVLLSFLLILCNAYACLSQKKIPEALRHELIIPPKPVDPQIIKDQDDMTWDDYRPVPGKNWADISLKPEREFRMALVAVDFPDQPFVITLPKGSDLFGNPQTEPVERADVPKFYADFWLIPSELNHGQTINGYWMEQSRGKFGIKVLDAFGPYTMPKNLWEYGLNEYKQGSSAPFGAKANKRMEPHVDSLWKANAGDLKKNYDAILRIYAGYDETGVWQEFGEMKFLTRDDIPPAWGNPDTTRPRWVPTRYVPWTTWKAGQMQWGLSSIRQGENSGTITHELGHFAFDIGDNNNNPYVQPYRRVGSGPWDMMDRGSFNGPGGPHMRWVVPAAMGASMPAGLMLRNRMVNGFISESQVLTISREKLASSGPEIASLTARAVEPQKGSYAGIIVRLDGPEPHDRTRADDPGKNPLSPGIPNYDFYSIEVVQRMGYDSFCPDNGVLIAKNKDKESRNGGPNEFNCFNWVIDAHPEDINMIDFIRPDGRKVMRTIADYRQLNDALFHAGVNSGSSAEYVDTANSLHFYVIDVKEGDGILNYEIGVRSLGRKNPVKSSFKIHPLRVTKNDEAGRYIFFKVKNTGKGKIKDILRLSAESEGTGWSVRLLNNFVTLAPGDITQIPVFVSAAGNATYNAIVNFTVVSESDPSIGAKSFKKIRKQNQD